MFAYPNLTTILMLQNAFGLILNRIEGEINAHATCIITDGNSHNYDVHLNQLPAIRGDCPGGDKKVFINQVQHGVTIGCSFFVVWGGCAIIFVDNFHEIHDWVDQKYEKKVLVVIDIQNVLTHSNVMDILKHRIVINDLPLTMLLQPNESNEWIYVWSAYPYDSSFQEYNRFFPSNLSLRYDKAIIPKLTDLNGLRVYGGFINYPPYASYEHVPPGNGNAELFGSNETKPLLLDGQENLILIEFCLIYNCTLTGRLEYNKILWGESFDNHTGTGMIGGLIVREANVSVAAMYLWDKVYKFTQYSAIIQRATATHIVPKPSLLPYWTTPLLPFPGYIWGYVMCSFLVGALTLFLVNVSQTQIHKKREAGDVSFGLFDSIYTVFKVSLFQSVKVSINFLSTVAIFVPILTFALVIGNLYSGGLSSVMTITRYEHPIESLERLVKSKLLWGGTTQIWLDAIQQSNYPTHKQFIKKYMVKPIPELGSLVHEHSIAVTLEMMQHGTLSYQSYIDKDASKYYMIMKHPMYWEYTIVIASQTWPFMEQLNRIVFMQQESGIRYYWEHSSAARTMDFNIQRKLEENGKRSQAGEPIRLSVEHVLGALFLLLFGNALATISFSIEILFNYYKRKKLKVQKL